MRYKVEGARLDSGEEVTLTVSAESELEAMAVAANQGVAVAAVRRVGYEPRPDRWTFPFVAVALRTLTILFLLAGFAGLILGGQVAAVASLLSVLCGIGFGLWQAVLHRHPG
jgi:hypothetical protein